MQLKNISPNCNEVNFTNGNSVLFSYKTPVAVVINLSWGNHKPGVYKTAEKFSNTTTKHINAWTSTTRTLPQDELVKMAEAAAGME
jgi:hypothetical protein